LGYDCNPSPAAEPRPLPQERGEVLLVALKSARHRLAQENDQPNLAPFRGEVAALPRVRGICNTHTNRVTLIVELPGVLFSPLAVPCSKTIPQTDREVQSLNTANDKVRTVVSVVSHGTSDPSRS
jgi:hypothetical protein